jgi:hypothetical protein
MVVFEPSYLVRLGGLPKSEGINSTHLYVVEAKQVFIGGQFVLLPPNSPFCEDPNRALDLGTARAVHDSSSEFRRHHEQERE